MNDSVDFATLWRTYVPRKLPSEPLCHGWCVAILPSQA